MGSASLLTLTNVLAAQAQQVAQAQMAQAGQEIPEQVLITGSLIHGTAAVGVPVTNLSTQDFTQTGNVTIGDLFRTVPQANVAPGPSAVNSGGHQERETRVNIRGLDATGPRSLLLIDGVHFPAQADGICAIDPSIIPALALDRVDILADGASAAYGSDAIAGVINVVLKRGFNGAVTSFHFEMPDKGGKQYQASQLYGRTWDGGDITLTYEWLDEAPVYGAAHSKYTMDYRPWGLDDQRPIGSSLPGTISVGKPSALLGTTCNNCWAVPAGTGPGQIIDWAALTANAANQHTNIIDPLKSGWEQGSQQKNSFTLTFDQRLVPGVSFFATGFYTNRRVQEQLAAFYSQGISAAYLETFVVPTTNPYYPKNAPNNLQVSYSLAAEIPPVIPAFELSYRYQFGVNLDLPAGWTGQLYDSRSYEANQYFLTGVSANAAQVALGNTVGGVTKPANVPYLNVFCDATKFQCNSPATLNYLKAYRNLGDRYIIEEKAAHFDGPLFDIPGGTVKAAIGGQYESDNVFGYGNSNQGSPAGTPFDQLAGSGSAPYTVWAGFTQLNVPVFGDNFNFPLFRKLDLEASWRHDQYGGQLQGGTSNPRVAFTWGLSEDLGATVRGSWGTSFRFANAGEYSVVLSDANGSFNFPNQQALALNCGPGNVPFAGSTSAALIASGFKCNDVPGGESWAGGPHPELRSFNSGLAGNGPLTFREGGTALAPETSLNYSIGFELAPVIFLKGLDVQATWYSVKINGVLQAFNTPQLDSPTDRFHTILPSDLGCGLAANINPASCVPFEKMVKAALADRNANIDPSNLTSVYWINDGSTVGSGFLKVDGIDWNASYDWDMENLGAWNVGITGTYYLHRYLQTLSGGPVIDTYHQNIQPAGGINQNGVETLPRMNYRARLGWSNGAWSATGFVNYSSHFFQKWPVPPNVNNQCIGQPVCTQFLNIQPSFYTFDLSLGYDTGDTPANNYLKNLTLQFTIKNLMGIHSDFQYGPSTSARNVSGYDIIRSDSGRIIGFTVVKNW